MPVVSGTSSIIAMAPDRHLLGISVPSRTLSVRFQASVSSTDEREDDASDGRGGGLEAFPADEDGDLALAAAWDCRRAPPPRPGQVRASIAACAARAARGSVAAELLPAIEGGARDTDGSSRLPGRQSVGDRPPPATYRVASSRRFDMGGLRVEKTRRDPAVSDNVAEQAKKPACGSPF